MPAILDRCVRRLMKDPNFKPKDPKQGKESAAFAVCNAQLKDKLKSIDKNLELISEIQKSLNDHT